MTDIKRLGLGCMGMNFSNEERSIETIHYALDHGIRLLNTGEFYGGGESEMVLREALKGIPRENYFISVKFGMLPLPKRGMYGIDVNPWNIKAHLAYSLHRLGLDYIDLYEPARIDESIQIEDIITALKECVEEGFVRHIGLTELSLENLKRANKVSPIHTVELSYGLSNRSIETNGILDFANRQGMNVLAFAVLNHGILSNTPSLAAGGNGIPEETRNKLLEGIKKIAESKNTTVEQLLQAYVWNKNPNMSILIGTTRIEHLKDSLEALNIELTKEDIFQIEQAFPTELIQNMNRRNFTFRNGKFEGGH